MISKYAMAAKAKVKEFDMSRGKYCEHSTEFSDYFMIQFNNFTTKGSDYLLQPIEDFPTRYRYVYNMENATLLHDPAVLVYYMKEMKTKIGECVYNNLLEDIIEDSSEQMFRVLEEGEPFIMEVGGNPQKPIGLHNFNEDLRMMREMNAMDRLSDREKRILGISDV